VKSRLTHNWLYGTTVQTAEKDGISGDLVRKRPSKAEAHLDFAGLMRGLKTPASLRIKLLSGL
jgi:hypothetical protein